jgi:hypothetical protein
MTLLSIEEVKAGLVLEKDVKNGHGQILIRAGSALTDRYLTLLRSWGIVEVAVKGEGPSSKDLLELQDITPENFAKAEALLRDKFARAVPGEPVMKELFRHCVVRKAKVLYG